MKYLSILILGILGSMQAVGQQNLKPSEETINAMSNLKIYEGSWSGEGWIQMGPQKSFFTIDEKAGHKVGGGVFVFEGLGHDKTSKEIIHQAYGIVTYDDATDAYSMRAFRADAKSMDADFSVDQNGLINWGFEVPQGKISYVIEVKEGQWIEKGTIEMGGGRSFQFMEMLLERE
ncbi:hypothetical protein [uncultured Arcticibacterium sp.]|uniref:hypothetical protein n=1 Tax=uncultured Arcticibacterium sp. TaxID=2173042 RepID=UPI0030F792A1